MKRKYMLVIANCKCCTGFTIDRGYDSESTFIHLRFTDYPKYDSSLVRVDEPFRQLKFGLSEVVKKIEDHESDIT
jgi:hypothetical protein